MLKCAQEYQTEHDMFNSSINYYSHTFPVYKKFAKDFFNIIRYIDNDYDARDIIQAITIQEKMFLECYSTCKDFHNLQVAPVMYNHGELRLFKIETSNKLFDFHFFSYKVDKNKAVTSVFINKNITSSMADFDERIIEFAINFAIHYTDQYLNKEFNAPLVSCSSYFGRFSGDISFMRNDILLNFPYSKTDVLLILDYYISIFNCLKETLNKQKLKSLYDFDAFSLCLTSTKLEEDIFNLVFNDDAEDVSKYTELAVRIFKMSTFEANSYDNNIGELYA